MRWTIGPVAGSKVPVVPEDLSVLRTSAVALSNRMRALRLAPITGNERASSPLTARELEVAFRPQRLPATSAPTSRHSVIGHARPWTRST
jgi:hypothetical protein